MSDDLALPASAPERVAGEELRVRCFVAVWPPSELRRELDSFRLPRLERLRIIDPARHHVTLRFLGQVVAPEAIDRLAGFRFGTEVAFAGPRLERLGPRHLVVPVSGLDDLAARVTAATSAVAGVVDARGFHGHLSLATGPSEIVDVAAGLPFECRFVVNEVALVASTPDGYTTLARFEADDEASGFPTAG